MTRNEREKVEKHFDELHAIETGITLPDEIIQAMKNAYVAGADYAIDMFATRWISVEEELPKNKELVFITDGEYTDTGFYEYTFDEWQPCEKWLGDITHWMPMPQPPKK